MQLNINYLKDKTGRIVLKSYYSSVSKRKRTYFEHHHAECELSTIISGTGIYTIEGKEVTFSRGDVFLFRGDEIHCLTDIQTDLLLLNIQFQPSIFWSDSDLAPALKILFARNKNFQNKIDIKNPMTQCIRDDILGIQKELVDKADGYKVIAKNHLFSALIKLVRYYDYVDNSVDYNAFQSTAPSMQKVLDYIDSNLDKQLTLPEIAEIALMSPTYFSQLFKKMNGVALWDYITIKRVERAIELLKTTKMTKLDIAIQCGFSSQSNFYKAFKKITDKKPGDFTNP